MDINEMLQQLLGTITKTATKTAGLNVATAGIGVASSMLGLAHSDLASKWAYQRQEEFYNNHLSMQAKVQEYKAAGLNPYGLVSAGAGATSAPSVNQGQTPSMDIAPLLGTLLDYKIKQRELDLREKEVAADVPYKVSLINVNDATVGKIFADTDKVSAETFILGIQGKYADEKERAALNNLLKDLDVKDAQISKDEATAAYTWLQSEWLPKLNQSQIILNSANTRAANARAAVDEFEKSYMDSHDGMKPPQGEIAALLTFLMNLTADTGDGGTTATQDLLGNLLNPGGKHSPIGGTVRSIRDLFKRKK